MSANPRRVPADTQLLWPPGNTLFPIFVKRGTVVDVVPGSALEAAHGVANLQDVSGSRGSEPALSRAWLAN